MNAATRVPLVLQQFFTQRLVNQKQASSHTIASYRDTFQLLLKFVQQQRGRQPSQLTWEDLDASLICAFLDHCEKSRHNGPRTRNLRLTTIRSFFRFASYQEPAQAARMQQILAIPNKRQPRRLIGFLTRPEVAALLGAPDQRTWGGRRDHAFLLLSSERST
jgi:site-specific recombinase XerD